MEGTITKGRIIKYTEEHALLKKNHNSLYKGKSCFTHPLKLFEKVDKHVDSSYQIDIVYLHFQKASNKAVHLMFPRFAVMRCDGSPYEQEKFLKRQQREGVMNVMKGIIQDSEKSK